MSIEEIRKRHEAARRKIPTLKSELQADADRAELLRVIDAVLEIPIDMHDGAELTVGDTREAIAILRGEGGEALITGLKLSVEFLKDEIKELRAAARAEELETQPCPNCDLIEEQVEQLRESEAFFADRCGDAELKVLRLQRVIEELQSRIEAGLKLVDEIQHNKHQPRGGPPYGGHYANLFREALGGKYEH